MPHYQLTGLEEVAAYIDENGRRLMEMFESLQSRRDPLRALLSCLLDLQTLALESGKFFSVDPDRAVATGAGEFSVRVDPDEIFLNIRAAIGAAASERQAAGGEGIVHC